MEAVQDIMARGMRKEVLRQRRSMLSSGMARGILALGRARDRQLARLEKKCRNRMTPAWGTMQKKSLKAVSRDGSLHRSLKNNNNNNTTHVLFV